MSDPVAAAAQRAFKSAPRSQQADIEAGAREALKPIREWFLKHKDDLSIPRLEVAVEDLLPLIYPSDQLSQQTR